MTNKKVQNILLSALIFTSVCSYITVEHIEFYTKTIEITELQQADLSMKFKFVAHLAEMVKEIILPSFT